MRGTGIVQCNGMNRSIKAIGEAFSSYFVAFESNMNVALSLGMVYTEGSSGASEGQIPCGKKALVIVSDFFLIYALGSRFD